MYLLGVHISGIKVRMSKHGVVVLPLRGRSDSASVATLGYGRLLTRLTSATAEVSDPWDKTIEPYYSGMVGKFFYLYCEIGVRIRPVQSIAVIAHEREKYV